MAKHKTLGQVYTPKWIINEILDLVDYNNKNIIDKYILEPSSGDGAFLLEIVERYINACLSCKISIEEIINKLETYIYAVEIDNIEYMKSLEKLNILVNKKLEADIEVKWKIYNQNTLDFYQNFIGFFDYVIGNPPYIRIHNLDNRTRELIKNKFLFNEGTIDIYLTFFEMGIKMLKSDGKLGYITPNSFLHNSSYLTFRQYLKTQNIVNTLIDFKANKIFNGYSTYTAITILNKNYNKNYFEYKELINNRIELINKIQYDNLSNKDWSFTNIENEEFLKELEYEQKSKINDFFDVQYGFATMRDKLYISKIREFNDDLVYFNNALIEKKILKTVIKGSRFKGIIDNNEKILFPYTFDGKRYNVIKEEILKSDYPYTYSYLLKNKEELESRDIDKGSIWYEFGRSQGIQTIHNEKIVLSTLINGQINFYKVPSDVLMYSGLFIIKNKNYSDWSIIENTLKSEEFFKYIRLTGKDFSGGYKSITSKQIKEFKISINNPNSLF